MTTFFDYARLTWPEVAALPRTTPLCIPLGTGYEAERIAAALGDPLCAGCDRVYLMSGHGGNCSFLVNVVKYAGERHRRTFIATAWLHTAGHLGAPAIAAPPSAGWGTPASWKRQ